MGREHNVWKYSKGRGHAVEKYCVEDLFPSIGLKAERNNSQNKKAVDLLVEGISVDVKTAFTAYPQPRTPAGLTSQEHLTLDHANVMKYNRNVLLLFLVRYGEPKVLIIPVGKVRDIMAKEPQRIYIRSMRSLKDKQKKVGIAISECIDLTHMFPAEVVDMIEDLP